MKLIDKDAVLADIERLKDSVPYFPTIAEKEAYKEGVDSACCKVYSLEVREVDIENTAITEWNDYIKKIDGEHDYAYMLIKREDYIVLAKHFFEFGLNASNPLTWEDMMLIHKCIKDAMNYHLYKMMEGMEGQKVVYQEVLKRFKAQKGEKYVK